MSQSPRFSFFGTPDFAVRTLDALEGHGLLPEVVVTAPDRPRGRGQKLSPTPVRVWAEKREIPTLTPTSLRKDNDEFIEALRAFDLDYNIVAAYGLIIPDEVLSVPQMGSVNVHPSLLPKYRGASPIEYQILNDEKDIGVTIMLMDALMDHGPILDQVRINRPKLLPDALELEKHLVQTGGELLSETLIKHFEGNVVPREQEHDLATYTQKITKEDSFLDLSKDPYQNFLRIQAFKRFRPYFFAKRGEKEIRVIVDEATFDTKNHALVIKSVIPEGGSRVSYEDFIKTVTL